MIKIILIAKKRPDLSAEQFRDYYTNHHVPFMNRLLRNGAAVHRRNFVQHPDPANPGDYDVISEVFYEDRAMLEATLREMADPELTRQRIADESEFLLPESIRIFVVETDVTELRPITGFNASA